MSTENRVTTLSIFAAAATLSCFWQVHLAVAEPRQISFQASFDKDLYTYGEDMKLTYKITNLDTVPIEVMEPSFLNQTAYLKITESKSGKTYPPQVKWDGAWPLER